MKRRTTIILLLGAMLLIVPGFVLIRGVMRWSALESVIPSKRVFELKPGDPIVREFEEVAEYSRTDFGPFRATLPPLIIAALEIDADSWSLLFAETPAGVFGLMSCEIVERDAYIDFFEVVDTPGPARPWASVSSASAANSEAITFWWHIDSYIPPRYADLLLVRSDEFRRKFVSRTAWATLAMQSDSPIEYVVTEEAVARIMHSHGTDDADRKYVELYSKSSELSLIAVFKSDRLEWATDHALAFVRSFIDNTEIGASDSEIHQSLIDAFEQGLEG